MLDIFEITETLSMIDKQHLDIRTITMGISLLDCADSSVEACCRKIYDKITSKAARLVRVGEEISAEYGIPIVNKRISVTPISLVAAACGAKDLVPFALTLEKVASACGVNFLGGWAPV